MVVPSRKSVSARLWQSLLLLAFMCGLPLACAGLFLAAERSQLVYPGAAAVTDLGKCGVTEWSRHRGNLKRARYECYRTPDEGGHVDVWYASRGYGYVNDGWVRQGEQDGLVHVTRRERVYHLDEGERTMIRVYRDTVWRFSGWGWP